MYNDGGIFIVFGFLIILRSYISLMSIYECSLPSYSTSYVPLVLYLAIAQSVLELVFFWTSDSELIFGPVQGPG